MNALTEPRNWVPCPQPVPARYYQRFCVYGRSSRNLIASVALRAPTALEAFSLPAPYVVLDEVWTHRKHRTQGYATGLLELAKNVAYRHGWVIMCRPQVHDTQMTQVALRAFYAHSGWTPMFNDDWLSWQHPLQMA
jgi:GNAT superfamily N-acetyltransferase